LAPVLVVSALSSASAAPQCALEHADYVAGNSKWAAGFRQIPRTANWLTNVAFYVQSGATKRKYWFLFDAGSGRYINMLPTMDVMQPGWRPRGPDEREQTPVRGDMHYFPVDAKMGISLAIPKAGDAAPAYILLPDLQEVMWYDMADPMKREAAPLAFFKLAGCNSN
jgi:hypothetical protein